MIKVEKINNNRPFIGNYWDDVVPDEIETDILAIQSYSPHSVFFLFNGVLRLSQGNLHIWTEETKDQIVDPLTKSCVKSILSI